jgi:hypothetical protein
MPSMARTSSGIAAKNRNTIRTSYHRSRYRPIRGDQKREGTNIELIKGSKTNDDDWIGALCFDVAKEDRKADENQNEEKVGRRGGQGTDEEDPCIDLESSQAGERNMRETYSL